MIRSKQLLGLTAATLFTVSTTHGATFAHSVLSYEAGAGVTANTDPSSALGEPSRVTPGAWGGPVDPFNPPYLAEQIVSIGAGGWLTLGFESPIANSLANPFGLDFIIFGNAGFMITNGDFSGGGITDGSLFGASEGATRVSVSRDNLTWFTLNPALAPGVDSYFPTDGSGDFTLPVNPALSAGSFSGLDLGGIHNLYGGSGGGTAFDLSWAIDAEGAPVHLPDISFLRIDVLDGVAQIDGVVAVPEPGTWALLLGGGAVLLLARRGRKRA
jgi:hypothetical protein